MASIKLISAATAPVHKRVSLNVTSVTKLAASGKRRIRGMASTSAIDRQGDVVDPRGGTWALPVVLLWAHQHTTPVGWVQDIQIRGSGLWVECEFAEGVGEADRVWSLVDKGLVAAFSIGFRPIKSEPLPGGGLRFLKWELLEVSVVAIPANADAKIQRSAVASRIHPGIPLIQSEV